MVRIATWPRTLRTFTPVCLVLLFAPACTSDSPPDALQLWAHAGRAAERDVLEAQVARYNASSPEFPVEVQFLPEGSYAGQVQAAAIANDLPDILELDGPFVANYAWQGSLRPLDALLEAKVLADLLPSILEQGRYQGALYAVGTFDSGLGLYARKSALQRVGARIPRGPVDAWNVAEFEAILEALATDDSDGMVLDLGLNNTGEWLTYGFSPVLQSAGGDLVARQGTLRATGTLNGPASAGAMEVVQGWIERGRVDPNLDDAAFVQGRVALSWTGHWKYGSYCPDGACEDLVLLPLPDFGEGSRTGQGSWTWSITRRCERPEAAAAFLEFLLRPEEVLAMTRANGAVPATRTAIARSEVYGPGRLLHMFVAQLEGGFSVPRPRTPAYPIISSAFQEAFGNIRSGVDVEAALSRAAATIDEDVELNRGYVAAESRRDSEAER